MVDLKGMTDKLLALRVDAYVWVKENFASGSEEHTDAVRQLKAMKAEQKRRA